MKVTSVELRPEGSSEVIDLSFRDPKSNNPYRVKSIAPLDADELIPQFYGTSGDSTKKYYNIVLKKREPVALIGLNPRFGSAVNNSYSDLRDRLFRLIATSRTGVINIVFRYGTEDVAYIPALVSKVESSVFTDKPEVQITFNCLDPMLKSLTRVEVPVTSELVNWFSVDVAKSTAPCGFRMRVRIPSAIPRLRIAPLDNEDSFEVSFFGGFLAGDELEFSSENNNKYIYLVRGSNRWPIADAVKVNSIWPILFPGNNDFVFSYDVEIKEFDYFTTYWAV